MHSNSSQIKSAEKPTLLWQVKEFSDLTPLELYEILRLRSEVFVLEQTCLYQDLDGKDAACLHVFGTENGSNELVAYARIVPAGLSYEVPAIGRVIVSQKYRGHGFGYDLMKKCLGEIRSKQATSPIKISAQAHLADFYENLGFEKNSELYEEDGIPHLEMICY
jgi:ElaA protein